MHGNKDDEGSGESGRRRRKEPEVGGAEPEAKAGPRARAAPPPRPPAVRAELGQVRTHMVWWQSCSVNYCGWVLSGLPESFSPAACGVRAETETKQITGHSPHGPPAPGRGPLSPRTGRRAGGPGGRRVQPINSELLAAVT